MAVVAFMSATGAPGTSVTCLSLSAKWQRQVLLLDADPSGATTYQAGYLRPTNPSREHSIANLALAHRADQLEEGVLGYSVAVPDMPHVTLLPGILSPLQAPGMAAVWPDLAVVLHDLEQTSAQDVIVDLGRLGMSGFADPLLTSADLALIVMRSHLPSIKATAAWCQVLQSDSAYRSIAGRLGLVVVGPGRPYTAKEIADHLGVPVAFTMPWDPVAADVLSQGSNRPKKFDRSPLMNGAAAAAGSVQTVLAAAAAHSEGNLR